MADSWRARKERTDPFLPEIAALCGRHLFVPAPVEDDQKRATDLLLLRSGDCRIAVRARCASYRASFGTEFTIRSAGINGAKSELSKVIAGFGDFMWYGFIDFNSGEIVQWTLIDLEEFRLWWAAYGNPKEISALHNHDRRSDFMAFDFSLFRPKLIVATSHPDLVCQHAINF